MLILPVHYGTEAEYETLKERYRRGRPAPESKAVHWDAIEQFPAWLLNDIAGFVILRVEKGILRYEIFAARSHTPPRKWKRDRRLKGRYTWYDQGSWSLKQCKRRPDYIRSVERCCSVIRKKIPAKFACEWSRWHPLINCIDWTRLMKVSRGD